MFWRKKDRFDITVEYITGKGIKTQHVKFKPHPVQQNVFTIMDGPSRAIRVTIKEAK